MSLDRKLRDLAVEAGDIAVLLYTWMIPHAEDDGVLKGDAEEILARVLPLWRWITIEQCQTALDAMAKLELIIVDDNHSQVIFPAEKFYKYQSYIKPDKRKTAQNAEEHCKTPQITASPSPTPSLSFTPSATPSPDLGSVAARLAYEAGRTNEAETETISEFIEWGMEVAAVQHAIKITRERGKPFPYLKGILTSWKAQGFKTLEEVKTERDSKPAKTLSPQARPAEEVLREQGILL
jgi:DnaD/phage-associated family protein